MAEVRIAVAGAGLIGRTHIRVLRSGSPAYTLAGVADPAPAAAEDARRLGYAHFASLEQLLDRTRPDGVVIAVPNQLHVSAGLACIERRIPKSTHAVLYALDARTGRELWSSGKQIASWNHFTGISLANGAVYINDWSGTLYRFGLEK